MVAQSRAGGHGKKPTLREAVQFSRFVEKKRGPHATSNHILQSQHGVELHLPAKWQLQLAKEESMPRRGTDEWSRRACSGQNDVAPRQAIRRLVAAPRSRVARHSSKYSRTVLYRVYLVAK